MSPPSTNDSGLSDAMTTAQEMFQRKNVAETYMRAENATRPFAKHLWTKTNLSNPKDLHVFDLACGTGACVAELYAALPKDQWDGVKVFAGDFSPPMIEYLEERKKEEGWKGVKTGVVDGNDLTKGLEKVGEQGGYTHVICNMSIFAMPNCLPAVHSTLKPGGWVGVGAWRSLAWQSLLNTSISQMTASPPPHNPSGPEILEKIYSGRHWEDESFIAQQFQDTGFTNVATEVKTFKCKLGTPDEFMQNMPFALQLVRPFWPADKADEYTKELMEIMLKNVTAHAGGADKVVEYDFEGIMGWGWKA